MTINDTHHMRNTGLMMGPRRPSTTTVTSIVTDSKKNPSRAVSLVVEEITNIQRLTKSGDCPIVEHELSFDKPRSPAEQYWVEALANPRSVPFPAILPSHTPSLADTTISITKPFSMEKDVHHTITTLLHAAWAIVVGHATSSTDVVFGAVTHQDPDQNEMRVDKTQTTCIVPVRVQLQNSLTVPDYLETLDKQTIYRAALEQISLKQISQLSADAQEACMFQTILIIEPFGSGTMNNIPRHDSNAQGEERITRKPYALTLVIKHEIERLHIQAQFDSNIISRWAVQNLLNRLSVVIHQLSEAKETQTLGEVELMPTEDLSQIWHWNKTVPKHMERCVHDVIFEIAQAHPNAPAVCAWDGKLSYKELDHLATEVAGRLSDAGFKPNTLIPLCFEKSMWATVSMLGVLKAGGSFVLLDASLPEKRLLSITKQIDPRFILSSATNVELSSRLARDVIEVSSDTINSTNPHANRISFVQSPAAPMFVVFTSGSTGAPKGVMQSHINFYSGVYHQLRLLGFNSKSRVFDYASYAFDIAVHNNFATLIAGGCICIPSDQARHDNIGRAISEMGATLVDLTPSVARIIDPDTVSQLETIILAGEAVSIDDVNRWWGKAQVINAYGPAECNFSSINWRQTRPDDIVGIGKGEGVVTWIIDPENHNRLVPLGCVGELAVEGPVVSLGYLNDSEKTQRLFVEGPRWLQKGCAGHTGRNGRIYKTGDLVRYNEDGSLCFLGRKDTQVKIRGQRVELGEVEFWIRQCRPDSPHVTVEAISPKGDGGKLILVLFIQETNEPVVSKFGNFGAQIFPIPQQMEIKLSEHLPKHMVPTAIISLSKMPLTPTGKTDRKRLREIGSSFSLMQFIECSRVTGNPKRVPTSDAERQMQAMWASILDIEGSQIGIDDSFLHLGGNSITAMKLVGEARKNGLQFTVADVLRCNTISNLVRVQTHTSAKVDKHLAPVDLIEPEQKKALIAAITALNMGISAENILDIYPMTTMQEGYVVAGTVTQQFCNYFHFDIDAMTDLKRLKQGCQDTLEKFPILRACFLPVQGKMWQVVLNQLKDPFRVQDVDGDMEESFQNFCQKDSADFLSVHPPFELIALRHHSSKMRVVVRMSHAQYDGISLPIICQSLLGEGITMQNPTPQFDAFLSHALRRRSESIQYWKQLLQGSELTCIRNLVGPPEEIMPPKVIKLEAELPLLHCFERITIATLVSTAWALLLSRITRSQDIVYCHMVAGRNSIMQGIEEVVGCCLNIVLVRVRYTNSMTTAGLLNAVQEQSLAMGEADSLSVADIVAHCTNWGLKSLEAGFESTVHHRNVDETPVIQAPCGPTRVREFQHEKFPAPMITMFSSAKKNCINLEFGTSTLMMSEKKGKALLNSMVEIIGKMVSSTNAPLGDWIEDVDLEI